MVDTYAGGAQKKTSLGSALSATGSAVEWKGGMGVFVAYGTWGGGTAKLQFSPIDDGATNWFDVDASGETYVTLTADGAGGFNLPACYVRLHLASVTSISAFVQGIRQTLR